MCLQIFKKGVKMTEEIKETEIKEECFCKSKSFRKFLIIAGGSFVGVFCALSLFAALNKPPLPSAPIGPITPMVGAYGHPYAGHHMKHFKRHNCDCPCHKKMIKKMVKNMEGMPKPPEPKPEIED